jgi:hypothetical protein
MRINIDPDGALGTADLERGLEQVRSGLSALELRLVGDDLATLPSKRRELQFLGEGDPAAMARSAAGLCRGAFGTAVTEGTTTYLSRGSDDDALGVLTAFGLAGDVSRADGDEGWDVVTVRLAAADLRRVPESRIQTALEASLNCEVRIVAT